MSRGVYIFGGSGNTVTPDCTGLVAINCNNQAFTSDNSNTVNIKDGALVVDADGVTELVPAPKRLSVTGGTTMTAGNDEADYFCDATAGNISITITHTNIHKTFVRIDASANTVTLLPDSGLINGAGSYGLNVQYEKITVLSNGTNLYF